MLGTLGYLSPEQARARPVDHRADIFACGAVLYEMVTGQRAFRGDSPADTIALVLHRPPSELRVRARRRRRRWLPRVRRCLEQDPDRRFQSARELAWRSSRSRTTARPPWASRPVDTAASVAVLPFVNLSAAADDQYFSDGLAEDLVHALARLPGLRVASRTSSFRFRGRELDVRRGRARARRRGRARGQRAPGRHAAAAHRAPDQRRQTAITSGRSTTTASWPTCSRCRTRWCGPSSRRSRRRWSAGRRRGAAGHRQSGCLRPLPEGPPPVEPAVAHGRRCGDRLLRGRHRARCRLCRGVRRTRRLLLDPAGLRLDAGRAGAAARARGGDPGAGPRSAAARGAPRPRHLHRSTSSRTGAPPRRRSWPRWRSIRATPSATPPTACSWPPPTVSTRHGPAWPGRSNAIRSRRRCTSSSPRRPAR